MASEDLFFPASEPEEAAMSLPDTTPACSLNWDELASEVATCTACPLHQGRTQTVFGVGNRAAEWMFIGEAPGEQEDLQGEPFVGRAGQLLNEMIRAIGLRREDVYIANVLKCRPPKNRDPAPEEAAACEGYLKAQLALVKPKIILAVGRIAAQNLLKTATPIGKLRGQVHDYEQTPLVVTYHPAYLLRSQTEKRRAWEDLKLALRIFRQQAR
jgi:uracil-DNA glycosylase family 4